MSLMLVRHASRQLGLPSQLIGSLVTYQRRFNFSRPWLTTCSSNKSAIPPVRRITREDVSIQFARSSGAGGQNVNKVATKVDMRLNLDTATWIDEEIKDALRRMEKNRINKDGELVITSQRTRSQLDNTDDALAKLQEILDAAWKAVQPIEEDPEKKKQLENQKKKGNEKRLTEKKFKADKKKERRAKIDW